MAYDETYRHELKKAFDPKCLELAEYFLADSATLAQRNALAQHIQEAVEDWFPDEEEREDEPDSLHTLGLSERDFR